MRHVKIENLNVVYTEKGEDVETIKKRFNINPIFPIQKHTNNVCILEEYNNDICDGLITFQKNKAIGVKTADCIPLVLTDFKKVAVIHAGWRGLVSGIVGNALKQFANVKIAFVAPFIKECCYGVQEDFFNHIPEEFKQYRMEDDYKLYFSLEKALIDILKPHVQEIFQTSRCTKCDGNLYSYRNGDKIERMLTVAWLE